METNYTHEGSFCWYNLESRHVPHVLFVEPKYLKETFLLSRLDFLCWTNVKLFFFFLKIGLQKLYFDVFFVHFCNDFAACFLADLVRTVFFFMLFSRQLVYNTSWVSFSKTTSVVSLICYRCLRLQKGENIEFGAWVIVLRYRLIGILILFDFICHKLLEYV